MHAFDMLRENRITNTCSITELFLFVKQMERLPVTPVTSPPLALIKTGCNKRVRVTSELYAYWCLNAGRCPKVSFGVFISASGGAGRGRAAPHPAPDSFRLLSLHTATT